MKSLSALKIGRFFASGIFWKIPALLAFLYISIDVPFTPFNHGIDPSWQYAISRLSFDPQILWGRDIVFSYGPLGFLVVPMNVGPALDVAVIYRFGMHALLGGILAYYLLKARSNIQALFFCLALYIGFVFHHRFEFHLYLTTILAFWICMREAKAWWIGILLSAPLSVAGLFMKFNIGVSFLGICLSGCVFALLLRKANAGKILGSYLAACVVSFLLIALMLPETAGDLLKYLYGVALFASGYSFSQGLPTPPLFAQLALAFTALYAILVFTMRKDKGNHLILALMLGAALFFAWKIAFTRGTSHVRHWPSSIFIICACLIINSENEKQMTKWIWALTAAFVLSMPAVKFYNSPLFYKYLATGKRAQVTVDYLAHYEKAKLLIQFNSRKNQWPTQFPEEWVEQINREKATVDMLPWELSYIASNPVRWSPSPTLQLYICHHPYLDTFASKHFSASSTRAPDYIVLEWRSFDGYHTFWEAPATWRNILENYFAVDFKPRKGRPDLVLLKRKPAAVPLPNRVTGNAYQELKTQQAQIGEWINVPASDSLVYGEVMLKPTLYGRLRALFFRLPQTWVEVRHASGRTFKWRVPPKTIANGLILNALPPDLKEMMALIQLPPAPAADRLVAFRFHDRSAKYFHREFELRWMKTLFKVRFNPKS